MPDHEPTGSPTVPVHATTGQPIFSPAEIEEFKAEDRSAATAIVCLMAGIFTIGLIGYLGVCYWVTS